MTEILKERARCAQVIKNAMKRHSASPAKLDLLKGILTRIQNPRQKKSTGRSGGPLNEQLVLPLTNSIDDSASPT
jgi:hypothetical protein